MEVSSLLHVSAPLPPGKEPPGTHSIASWMCPEHFWMLHRREKSLAPAGNRTPGVQPIARRYADWTIPVPQLLYNLVDLYTAEWREIGKAFEHFSIVFLNRQHGGYVNFSDGRNSSTIKCRILKICSHKSLWDRSRGLKNRLFLLLACIPYFEKIE
jgi:hypothetical protein